MSKPRTRIPAATPWVGYGVPSPTDGAPTFWWVDGETRLRPWPAGTRYAPLPPKYDATSKHERTADLKDWYEDVYFEFLRQVADAIAADFDGAAARFRAAYPGVVIARPPAAINRERNEARLRYEAIVAASRARRGASTVEVSKHLGVAWVTARARVAAGERLLAVDPDGCRRFVAEYLRRVLEDDSAEHLAATILDGSHLDAARIATRQVLAEVGSVARPQPAGEDVLTHALRAFLAGGAR